MGAIRATIVSLLFLAAFAAVSKGASDATTTAPFSPLSATLKKIRGGVSMSPYEPNPDYVPPPQRKRRLQPPPPPPLTVGDLDNFDPAKDTVYFKTQTYEESWTIYEKSDASPATARESSVIGRIRDYAVSIHRTSPTLSVVSSACVLFFAMWQVPSLNTFMQRNFVCSHRNVREGRIHSLALAAVSHASPLHLAVNLATFLGLGPSLRQGKWPLWHLVLGATFFGSFMYLLRERGGGGCLGLSGVTLAMLALQAKLFPEKEFAMMLAVIPVRMKARATLTCLLTWSLMGCVWAKRSPVAHITHLAGLMYGMGYFELWIRRYQLRWMGYKLKRMLSFGNKKKEQEPKARSN